MHGRVYAATNGQCLAGDRMKDYGEERELIQQDFAAGIRFVVDEQRHEIRGFVPVDRGSREAFFVTTVFEQDEQVGTREYYQFVQETFSEQQRWHIRSETPEGHLLSLLDNRGMDDSSTSLSTSIEKKLTSEESVQIGVPDYETAIRYLDAARSLLAHKQRRFVIGLSPTVNHVPYNLLVHVSSAYDTPSHVNI